MAANNTDSLIFSDLIAEYDFVVDDLSVWEIVNPSSSEAGESSDDDFSVAADEKAAEASDSVADEEEPPLDVGSPSSVVSMEVNQLDGNGDVNGVPPSAVVVSMEVVNQVDNGDGEDYSAMIATIDAACDAFNGRYNYGDGPSADYEEEEEDHDSYDEEYEYGDRLFPYSSSNKYGRQRAKKSGKKIVHKPKQSPKQTPCRYSKRCVYGKGGLGATYSYL